MTRIVPEEFGRTICSAIKYLFKIHFFALFSQRWVKTLGSTEVLLSNPSKDRIGLKILFKKDKLGIVSKFNMLIVPCYKG